MSELTFNIADYRPLSQVRQHRIGKTGPIVLVRSNSEPRESEWLQALPAVVDIRSVREGCRSAQLSYPRRGKVLRFANDPRDHVYTMPIHTSDSQSDDDPDPIAA